MTSGSNPSADERFAIGLDVGTSAVKGAVLTSAGRSFSYVSTGYATHVPAPGHAEQDPDDWWNGVGEVLGQMLQDHPSMVAANTVIGLTGQMHTTVARDENGRLIRPAILWSDTRASNLVAALTERVTDWEERAGYAPIPAFTSAHLAWLWQEEPDAFERIARVCVPKDDIRQRFGAGWATEPSDASAMNLMNTRTDTWEPSLLEAVGLRVSQLPPIVPSSTVTGHVRLLPPTVTLGERLIGTPVVAGAADQAAQAVALGAISNDSIAVSVGTSGAAFQAIAQPRTGAFRHAVPDTWLALDSTHAAGLALAWWADVSQRPVGESPAVADQRDLPVFLPYLQGGRDGHGAPGTLTDLRSTHGARDIADAVVEGVAIELIRLVREASGGVIPESPIGVGGRAAQIEALRLIMAAGLDRPIRFSSRGPAAGAAMLAAKSRGWADDAPLDDTAITTYPDPEHARRLAPRIARYSHLIEQLS